MRLPNTYSPAPAPAPASGIDRSRYTEAGFTVVEMLVALAIMTVVMVPTLMLLQNATRAESVHAQQVDAIQQGSVAYEWLNNDLRSATKLEVTGSTSLEMARVDNNGNAESVFWVRDGELLIRSASSGREIPSKTVILDDLDPATSSAAFSLRDAEGNEMRGSATCATSIDVQLDRLINAEGDSLSFSVALRGLDRTGATC